MSGFIVGVMMCVGVALVYEAVQDLRERGVKRRYHSSVFMYKHRTQNERPGSIEYFKRVMGRGDEI